MKHRSLEKGVALVSALVVVALAATAAVSMTSSQHLGIRKAENLISRDQAYQYLLGAEQWVGVLLKRDAEETETDHLDEAWAQDLPPLPVEGGTLSGKLTDLSGRININEVVDADGNLASEPLERIRKLIEAAELSTELLDPVVDWIDSNNEAFSSTGAEDNYYFSLEKPYRTSNQPLASASELLLLRGMEADAHKKLKDLVCALPDPVTINVNTAPLEVLMALGLDKSGAENVIETRPFEKLDDFIALDQVKEADIKKDGLDVNSTYFRLEARAQIGRSVLRQFSILKRDGGKVTVIARSLGTE